MNNQSLNSILFFSFTLVLGTKAISNEERKHSDKETQTKDAQNQSILR